ncbi:MAG TPA: sulfite exporter TauE/SafE family protein [Bacteroidales bacterium]|nr:MAG: hypothetical protein A2W98_03605 [Bacteroidetes bacterium GWF2_33_38]OFY68199.1 MAG: hypothetical protein A2265_01355 [Bacteroidetes bacterium RIFOXYA12_FULL_33_9]OFY84849.1 MAG: hypothetical protein A2236_09245 [Bacteroidetes bacterium RIFOXYA2_FULL_33_7]HBF87504.1 sulfite exporter TauE/SafE family protein [Bacteroidales bacterium]
MDIQFTVLLLIILALYWEYIDSAFGMLYGTALTPILLIMGYTPTEVVPSILISQAIGGSVASWRHHDKRNAIFNKNSKDFRIALLIFISGIIAVVIGAIIGKVIPAKVLAIYIGFLVIVMGIIILLKQHFKFSWKKVALIGFISSFNKAISGGGFGPLVASGLVISGKSGKSSIGITDFAEAPICFAGFIVWIFLNKVPDYYLFIPLCVGAAIGGFFGPSTLARIKSNATIVKILGFTSIFLGIWTLLKTFAE